MSQPTRGIVLAGGGARGAYEAGVLSYLFEELPLPLLEKAPVRVVCGTSVGAIHACYLAATAHLPRHNVGRLVDLWRSLRIEDMLRLGPRQVLRLPREFRALSRADGKAQGVFLNSRLLQQLVVRNIPWDAIRDNLRAGLLDALTVSATHVASGQTTVFVDRAQGGVPSWTRDRRVVAKGVRMSPAHALASAAIPFLFPPIQIEETYYSDGGVRQNTPLSPALRLGVDRVLVVGLRHADWPQAPVSGLHEEERYPGFMFMLGKLVDALMLDRLDYDLERLEGFNMLLRDGHQSFGDDFYQQISRTAERIRGARYRHIDSLVIRPSRDIGEMANDFVDVFREKLGRWGGWMFGKLAHQRVLGESDLLSYICFDGRLAAALIELGRADADAARQSLIDFFSD